MLTQREIGETLGRSGASLRVNFNRLLSLVESFSEDDVPTGYLGLKLTEGRQIEAGH